MRAALLLLLLLTTCAPQSRLPDRPELVATPEVSATQTDAADRCEQIVASVDCPAGTELDVFLGTRRNQGQTFCEVQCLRRDQPHGPYAIVKVSSDDFEVRGSYADGEKEGLWTTWGRNAEWLERVRWKEQWFLRGTPHGPHRRWHPGGEIAVQGTYIDGKKDGDWQQFAPNGEQIFAGTFERGRKVGEHTESHLNGKLASQRAYDELGRPHGDWCFWLPDGALIACTSIAAGTGPMREYGRNGKLAKEYELLDGELHGRFVDYVFGLNRYEAFYREGQQHGPERVFFDDCIDRETTWANGRRDGRYVENSCDVGPAVQIVLGQYCSGNPCGRWTYRRPHTGHKTNEVEYSVDGEVLGEVNYDEHGQVLD